MENPTTLALLHKNRDRSISPAVALPSGKYAAATQVKEYSMTTPKEVFEHLAQLEQGDLVQSASYREEAQEVLADNSVSLQLRQAIADRLNQANHDLALHTVGSEDSY